MKKTIMFFLLTFFTSYLQGQSFSCGNEVLNPTPASTFTVDYDDWITSVGFDPLLPNPVFNSSYSIPLHIVIVAKDDGTLPPFTYSIAEHVEYMNSLFTNGMEFYICDIEVISNSTFFDIDIGGEVSDLYDFHHVDDAINVYFTNSVFEFGGIADFPWNGMDHGVVVKSNELLRVLSHEIGHFFGLHHTHNCTVFHPFPTSSSLDPDCIGELVNGVNAHLSADRMIDTPADPGAEISTSSSQVGYCDEIETGCDGTTNCYNVSTGVSPYLDPNNDPYDPDIYNIMGYYNCGDYHFSLKQLELMEKALLNEPNLNYLLSSNPPYCEPTLPANGNIKRYCELDGDPPLQKQSLTITTAIESCETTTNEVGEYDVAQFCNLGFEIGSDVDFTVVPKLYDPALTYHNARFGVNVFDLVKLQEYILGISNTLDTPYKIIAADVNNNGILNASDLYLIQQVILQNIEVFSWTVSSEPEPVQASWRYLPSYYQNSNSLFDSNFSLNPFSAQWVSPSGEIFYYNDNPFTGITEMSFMDALSGNLQNSLFSSSDNWSFKAIKIGDIDCSATSSNGMLSPLVTSHIESREDGVVTIIDDLKGCLKKGSKGKILFSLSSSEDLLAYQMGLKLDTKKLRINNLNKGDYNNFDLEDFNYNDLILGKLKTVWLNQFGETTNFSNDKTIFSIEIEALEDICNLSDLIQVDNEILNNNFLNLKGEIVPTSLSIKLESNQIVENQESLGVNVYPNPSTDKFTFEINLEYNSEIVIQIYDYLGNTITQKHYLKKGKQHLTIEDTSALTNGILYYSISTNNDLLNGKLLKVK